MRFQPIAVVAALVLLTSGCGRSAPPNALGPDTIVKRSSGRVEVISQVYRIDKIYPSMTGPWSEVPIQLLEQKKPEIVWITGAAVKMLDATGKTRMPDELMCHANLDLDSERHCQEFGLSKTLDGRIFTLSQGQLNVQFPPGMGIPVRSDLPLTLVTQVLNLNLENPDLDVRHHVTIDFVRDQDAPENMIPLYQSGVSSQVSLEDQPLAFDIMDHGTGTQFSGMCIPGQKAIDWDEQQDRYGRRFTGHWQVPPGRQTNRTRCTSIMNVPYDTKLYTIAVHLHPFAESLELRDVTTGKSIFKSHAQNFSDRIGLKNIETFTSAAGMPIYKHHEYELVSQYNNTSQKNADSMAVMYLYLEDTEFDRKEVMRRLSSEPSHPQGPLAIEERSTGRPRM